MTIFALRAASPDSPAPQRYRRFYSYPGCPFYSYPGCLQNRFVEYLSLGWVARPNPLAALIERLEQLHYRGVERIIVANEVFGPQGNLRNNRAYREIGPNWLSLAVSLARLYAPDAELWVTDCRPRDWRKWAAIREACSGLVDGVGIQIHAELLPCAPPVYASPQNMPAIIRNNCRATRAAGLKLAFSEVTCWAAKDWRRSQWYRHTRNMAIQEGAEWMLLWSPTPLDRWHWASKLQLPTELWDAQGQWLMGDWEL